MRTNLTMKLATLLLAVLALLAMGVVVAVKSINLDQIKELLTTQVKTATGSASAYQLNLLEVKIENAVVAQLERSTGKTELVEVKSLTIQPDKNSSELLAVRLAAKIQGSTIESNGTVGTFAAAIGGKPWPLHLKGGIEGLTF